MDVVVRAAGEPRFDLGCLKTGLKKKLSDFSQL
jgi:hypothetical protein